MGKQKHTPGIWTADSSEMYTVVDQDGGRLAIATNLKGRYGLAGRREPDEVAANARLMAASPELLEVLKEIIPDYERDDYGTDAIAAKARRVIAKAEGRQP
jgi:hypothetical protein